MTNKNDNEKGKDPKDHPPKPEPTPGFKVEVTYNGITKTMQVLPKHSIAAVIDAARPLFGSPGGDLVLVDEAGRELAPERTVQDEGVKPHAKLLLRPRTVRGG